MLVTVLVLELFPLFSFVEHLSKITAMLSSSETVKKKHPPRRQCAGLSSPKGVAAGAAV